MRLKTSCFNPSLGMSSLRRFWPLPVCSFFAFLLSLVLPLYHFLHAEDVTGLFSYQDFSAPVSKSASVSIYLGNLFLLQTLLVAAGALVAALLLFHHLHGKKEIQFYLSFPIRRSGLYCTAMFSGLLMILLPMAICYGLAAGICLYFHVGLHAIMRLFAAFCLILLLFYGMSVLACLMAGQSFGAFLLYAGMHGAALVIWMGLSKVVECFVIGFSSTLDPPQWLIWLIPLVHLFSVNTLDTQNDIQLFIPLIYGLTGVILLVLSGVLYQIRRAETAGEMLSFSFVKVLSKILASLAVGLGGFALLRLIAFPDQALPFGLLMLLVLVLIAIGWIAAEMVIQKSFRIFHSRSVLLGGALLVVAAALMLGAKADAFGYIHRTPDFSSVESASLSLAHGQGFNYTEVSPTDALAIHRTVLEHTEELVPSSSAPTCVQLSVSYGLQDGSTMERTYSFEEAALPELVQAALAVLDQPENVMGDIFRGWTTTPTTDTFFAGTVYSYIDDSASYFTRGTSDTSELSAQEALTLYAAVRKDIEEGNVPSSTRLLFSYDEDCPESYGSLFLAFFNNPYDASDGSYSLYQETAPRESASIDLFLTMANTIAAMENMGFQFAK